MIIEIPSKMPLLAKKSYSFNFLFLLYSKRGASLEWVLGLQEPKSLNPLLLFDQGLPRHKKNWNILTLILGFYSSKVHKIQQKIEEETPSINMEGILIRSQLAKSVLIMAYGFTKEPFVHSDCFISGVTIILPVLV